MSTEPYDPSVLDYGQRPARLPDPADPTNDQLDIPLDTRLALYESQLVLRQFEKRAYDMFLQNLVKGTSHLSLGMEAVAAGFGAAMRSDDYSFATYRGHAHTLARGVPMGPVLAELLARENGLMAGKGGSMHLTSVEHGMMGSYAIIGAHLTIANGAAWSAQMRGTGQVAVCFFGDGTTNIGAFHEALNLAAVWKLPVVFVCENNLYMEYTPIDFVTAVENPAADRASAYGLEPILVDGNDADAVYAAAARAMGRARRGEGPSLVEARTYRDQGHSRADPGKYRPAHEVAAWKERDPIPLYHQRLLRLGVAEGDLAGIQQGVARRVDEATEFAKAGAPPGLDLVMKDVWADGGSAWRN
jgi:pyruvate dehydrogenase E1 component alpha subunit